MNQTSEAPKRQIIANAIRLLLLAAIPCLLILGFWLHDRNDRFQPVVNGAKNVLAESLEVRSQLEQLRTDFEQSKIDQRRSTANVRQFLDRFELDSNYPPNNTRLIFSSTQQTGCRWVLPAGEFRLEVLIYEDEPSTQNKNQPTEVLVQETWVTPGSAAYELDVVPGEKDQPLQLVIQSTSDSFTPVERELDVCRMKGRPNGYGSQFQEITEFPNTWSHLIDIPLEEFFTDPHTMIMKTKLTGRDTDNQRTSLTVKARILSDSPVVVSGENMDLIQYLHKEFRAVDTGYGCFQLSKNE